MVATMITCPSLCTGPTGMQSDFNDWIKKLVKYLSLIPVFYNLRNVQLSVAGLTVCPQIQYLVGQMSIR